MVAQLGRVEAQAAQCEGRVDRVEAGAVGGSGSGFRQWVQAAGSGSGFMQRSAWPVRWFV